MDKQKKPTTAAPADKVSQLMSIKPRRPLHTRMVQSFLVIWLDSNIDLENNNSCKHTVSALKETVNEINIFTDIDECIDFITDVQEERIFMIASGALGQITSPIIHDMPQISTIYIFCENQAWYEQWITQWPKIKGAFTDIAPICRNLQQAAVGFDQNMISINFVPTRSENSKPNLNQLDYSFMYTQIMKEILLTISFEQHHIDQFLTYCRDIFIDEPNELDHVNKLEQEYYKHLPIWWYTYPSFLYSMLNRSLRMMEVDLIITMGFFIRDLHNHIEKLHGQQFVGQSPSNSFTVYRGQGLSETEFNQLIKTKGGLLSFNSFLSTSKKRQVSLNFVHQTIASSDLVGILFIMRIDPSILSTPFAGIRDVSYFKGEEEILFSMHSTFRIGPMKQIDRNNRLWQVDLTLTSDNDPDLYALTERMREETEESTGWLRLGKLMVKLAQYNEAEDLHETLLARRMDNDERGNIFYQLGVIKCYLGEYASALTFYGKSLKTRQNNLSSQHPDVADCYNAIGIVHYMVGDYYNALSHYQVAMKIYRKNLPSNRPELATSYNNIGLVYDNMGDYSNALSYYQKAVQIRQKVLPSNHPDLATSYICYGSVCYKMGDYSSSISYHQKALEIYQKTLPPNHPDLATCYICHGSVYEKMSDYMNSLLYYRKALEIYQKTLPSDHPHLATTYNNIGVVYYNMDDYSNALSYHQKALEIYQNIFPSYHPDLAQSYSTISTVYLNLGDSSNALLYYQKAVETNRKLLPSNHPH
ncbi:unnamed protein product [Rotaria sp. Silwood1]|nr:unnamed protein product [Rotaria sp. Silwood1]